MSEAKFPISDKEMLELLHKYPFLRYRNVWNGKQCFHGKSKNLEINHYKAWDGTGWEELWKKYLSRLFKDYDSWSKKDQKSFCFTQIKEKYGTMRIYTSFTSDGDNELIAEMLSEYTCFQCGKRPIDENGKIYIWKSCGYILPFCDECKAKYHDEDYEKAVLDNDYAITQYEKDGVYRVNYVEKDGWLERTKPILIKENNK